MKKEVIKQVLVSFLMGLLVLFLGAISVRAYGLEQGSEATSSEGCALGTNINDRLQDIELTESIYGVIPGTYDVGFLGDSYSLTIDRYIYEKFSAVLDNSDGALHEGDYFTYKLDPAARLSGLKNEANVSVADLYVTDPTTGELELFAWAELDYTTNTITYILTDYIEDKGRIQFEQDNAWTIKINVIQQDGPYTFTDTFGNQSKTYTHNIAYGRNADARFPGNTYSFLTDLWEVNVDTHTYQQVGILNPRGTELTNGFTVEYRTNDEQTTPLDPSATFRVYEIPDDYIVPDTLGVNLSDLTDITDQLTTSPGSYGYTKYTFSQPTTKRYFFYLENTYQTRKEVNDQGIEVETNKTIYSGLNITTPGMEQNTNHYAYNLIFERGLGESGSVDGVQDNYCNRKRQIQIKKVDATQSDKVLSGAVFRILQDGNVIEEITTDENGNATSSKLALGTYSIEEVTAPNGYLLLTEPLTVDLTKEDASVVVTQVTNQKIIPKTSISVLKEWKGASASKTSVALYANGNKIQEIELNASNGWKYTFADLNEISEDGSVIQYSIKEVNEENGRVSIDGSTYKVAYEGNSTQGFKIINSLENPPSSEEPPSSDVPNSSNPKGSKTILPSTGTKNNVILVLTGLIGLVGILAFKLKRD